MTNRTEVQTNYIDAYATKTGVGDGSVTPTTVSEFLQVLVDKVAMLDEIIKRAETKLVFYLVLSAEAN